MLGLGTTPAGGGARPSIPALCSGLALALLGAACSKGSTGPGPSARYAEDGALAIDLLVRAPERVLDPLGEVLALDEFDWPAAGGQAELGAGQCVEFLLEIPAATVLVGDARTEGDGMLRATLGAADPASERTTVALDVPAETAPFEIEVPALRSGPTLVRLEWLTESGGAPLRFERLERVEPDPAPRPPILFLSIDTLAAQSMSLYGYERETTPELTAFANECVVFERTKANDPWTIPSYTSQLSGQLSLTHLNESPNGSEAWHKYLVAESRWTLPEALRSLGYETAAIYDNVWLGLVVGMLQGFDHVDGAASDLPLRDTDGGLRTVFPLALDWLDERGEEPFFLFAQIVDVHAPYLPVEGFRGRFGSDRRDGERRPVVPSKPPTFGGISKHVAAAIGDRKSLWTPADALRAAYDEKIAEVDAEIGRFLGELRKHPRWDEFLVIISADHGESVGRGEFYFRHSNLSEDTLHVPLLVRLPGGELAGTRVDETVDLLGLYPTLLDFLGLSPERPALHGRSFAASLGGRPLAPRTVTARGSIMKMRSAEFDGYKLVRYTPHRAELPTVLTHPRVLESLLGEFDDLADRIGVPAATSAALAVLARPGRLAEVQAAQPTLEAELRAYLVEQGDRSDVFHLPSDALEERPLADPPPEVVEMLERAVARADALATEARAARTGPTTAPALSETRKAELRALGYLDDDE